MTSQALFLTDMQTRALYHFSVGPTRHNIPAALAAAGYELTAEDGKSLWNELISRPAAVEYLGALAIERAERVPAELRPWDSMLPLAQTLQIASMTTALDVLAQLRAPREDAGDGDKSETPAGSNLDHSRLPLKFERVTGPVANLVRVGIKAAETVEAYAIGKPITRLEQGQPGEFETLDYEEALKELGEHVDTLRSLGALPEIEPGEEKNTIPPSP